MSRSSGFRAQGLGPESLGFRVGGLRCRVPDPPNTKYCPLWYIIVYWEYLILGGVGGGKFTIRGGD